MAEINLELGTMKDMCPSDIDIACYNSSSNFIVSGPIDSIKAFLVKLRVYFYLNNIIFSAFLNLFNQIINNILIKDK